MSSSGANPFTCDMLTNERRCGGDASHLYRTATATRLVCDTCAAGLRAAKRFGPAPIVEFALVELTPARVGLLSELRFARDTIGGNKAQIRQLCHSKRAPTFLEWHRVLHRLIANFTRKSHVHFQ